MAKNKKANVTAKTEEKKTTTVATETKKVDNPQVTNKEKEQPKEAPKETPKETPKAAPKKEEKKPSTPKKKEHVPEVIAEDVTEKEKPVTRIPENIPVGSTQSSFDGKANLAFVMQQRYTGNQELKNKYPEFYAAMQHNIDVVVVLALADLRNELAAKNESGELILQGTPDQILQLTEAANLLGIELTAPKALPGAKDGQLAIDFNEAKIPEELKEEAPVEEKKVELDPKKVVTTEQLIEALTYIMRKDKNPATAMVSAVEWYRNWCIQNADTADKKLELDDRTAGQWMAEIFDLVRPTAYCNGLVGAMYLYTSQTGNPVKSHCILHKHIEKTGWSEEQIADMLKFFVKRTFDNKVEKGEISEAQKDPKNNIALNAVLGTLGLPFIDKTFNDMNSDDADAKASAKATLGLIRTNYFSTDKAPTSDELRMKLGQIINLYRDPMERLTEFYQAEGEYPEAPKAKEEKKN